MSSLLHNLDRDSILMLYLADELSPEDLAEVEVMLHADLVLQGELSRLAEAQQVVAETLKQCDQVGPLPVPETVMIRRASRAMAQRQVDRLVSQPTERFDSNWRMRWLWSAVAAAAVILISLAILWNRSDDHRFVAVSPASVSPDDDADDFALWADIADQDMPDLEDEMATNDIEEALAPEIGNSDRQLSSTERELNALRRLAGSLR